MLLWRFSIRKHAGPVSEAGPPGTPRLVTWCPAEGQGLVTALPSLETMPVQLGLQSALRLCDSAWAAYFWVSLRLEQQEGLDLPPTPTVPGLCLRDRYSQASTLRAMGRGLGAFVQDGRPHLSIQKHGH